MGNHFFGFSPDAFEQFARALAIHIFGPGVKAFGNGPDGGREAIFTGQVPYPFPPADQWAGYGIIQAKCKEKPETTEKDQQWALKLLKKELDTFVTSNKRTPKPEYYVFITNVELSAAGKGWDKADSLIREYYASLPLKGHALWDANQLDTFLASYETLRRRFAPCLTPGDVLAELLADLEQRRPKTTHVLTTFLERELRADEAARLDQAGNRTEEQLRLARLFFDLPASSTRQLVPPAEEVNSTGKLPPGILAELLVSGSRKLDPESIYIQETDTANDPTKRYPTRYVLLGGPGSGKSTLGQFLAQIHRAALLARRPQPLLEPQTRTAITETQALCERDGLPWPATPRYPFRIELNRLANCLSSKGPDHVETLAQYILTNLKRDRTLAHEDLLEWLSQYPWLLILDGLDEVPLSSNRSDVIKSIIDFIAEARQVGADMFVVATSRHQGYQGEFGGDTVASRHITPLSAVRALHYVRRYAEARFGKNDPQRADDLVGKLRQSAKRELTAQLMSSPLQVTFMATVVAARGDPGEDRWQLFSKYYQTIYDRERQKAVPPYDTVLSKQQHIIDRLHHDIGFWLHHQGEVAGDQAVSLPISQFEQLVDAYLTEAGHEGDEKSTLVNIISQAAQQRLIFLTSRVEGELSFDVHSLKEYMAAECLMTGPPDIVKSRLRAIAPTTYWRNVFLFAAGKCFADAQSRHMQGAIQSLCEELNNQSSPLLEITRAGSDLALDVLHSGAVAENPNHARHLARIALDILAQPCLTEPPDERVRHLEQHAPVDQRFALVYRSTLSKIYQDALQLRVGQTDVERTLSAWPLLVQLIGSGVEWAVKLANQNWPSESRAQLRVVRQMLPGLQAVPWLQTKLAELIPSLPPSEGIPVVRSLGNGPYLAPFLAALLVLEMDKHDHRHGLVISLKIPEASDALGFELTSIRGLGAAQQHLPVIEQMPEHHSGWSSYVAAHEFRTNPNKRTLAHALKVFSRNNWEPTQAGYFYGDMPWPLLACLQETQFVDKAPILIQQVEQGDLGDTTDWNAAEDRWTAKDITTGDLLNWTVVAPPFTQSIAENGPPPYGCIRLTTIDHRPFGTTVLLSLLDLCERIPLIAARQRIAWLLLRVSSMVKYAHGKTSSNIVHCIEPSRLRRLLEATPGVSWFENVIEYPRKSEAVRPWIEFFAWLGNTDLLNRSYIPGVDADRWVEAWQRAFIADPSLLGLLRLLGYVASSGYPVSMIPPQMLAPTSFDEPRFRLAAVVVRMTQPSLAADEAQVLADVAAQLLGLPTVPHAYWLIFSVAERNLGRVPALVPFLLRLHGQIPQNVEQGVARCERILRTALSSKRSDLHSSHQLRKLQLPILAS